MTKEILVDPVPQQDPEQEQKKPHVDNGKPLEEEELVR
jgi:hypothetical protein